MYRQFNIQQFYVLPTQCIYVFCVGLRTNSDYFPKQHYLTSPVNVASVVEKVALVKVFLVVLHFPLLMAFQEWPFSHPSTDCSY